MRMMRMWRLAAVMGIAMVVAGILAPEARAQAFGASVVVQGDEMLVAEPGPVGTSQRTARISPVAIVMPSSAVSTN